MSTLIPREVILALSDPAQASQLRGLLLACAPSFSIVSVCHTSATAMQAIFTPANPPRRLIFIDYALLSASPQFILHLDHMGSHADCILTTDAADFTQLRFALRCGVCDCLLMPTGAQEIETCLQRTQDKMHRIDTNMPAESNEASRYLFWRNDVRRLSVSPMTMAQVNKQYGTRFSEGLFRALFVELSAPGCVERVIDNEDMQDRIIRMSSQLLQAECFDIIHNRHANGVSMLLNFSTTKRGHITRLIDQFFFGLRREFEQNDHVEVTMAIGRVYNEFTKLPEIKQEILDARWARKQIGSGHIINAEDIEQKPLSPEQKHEMKNLRSLILHYFELLDCTRSKQYLEQFYESFEHILPIREMRLFTRSLMDFLFENYASELQAYGNPENLRHSYIARENIAANVSELHKISIENVLDIMSKIDLVTRRQYSQTVRDCLAIISNQHCKGIRLAALAEAVHLSPQYLSSLFHRETGQTISEYIAAQKLSLAQSMLEHSTKNVAEISDYLGFSDAHYFSKFFKAQLHVTPSEYRNIKQRKINSSTSSDTIFHKGRIQKLWNC